MPRISKTFAKLIVKNHMLKDWEKYRSETGGELDTVFVYYEDIDTLISALTKMKTDATQPAKGVRIYFSRYPTHLGHAGAILQNSANYRTGHVPTSTESDGAKTEFKNINNAEYYGKKTLLFIGVNENNKEILETSTADDEILGFTAGFSSNRIGTGIGINDIENHGELCPPPPTDGITGETLYSQLLFP